MNKTSFCSEQTPVSWFSRLALLGILPALTFGCAAPEDANDVDEVAEERADGLSQPVAQHGHLSVVGNQVRGEDGAPVQLKGMSLFWSQWSGGFWNPGVVSTLSDDWHASLVRAAMGVEMGGYLDNASAEKARVKTVVDAAIAKGIYVIIDWHDHNATQHTDQAKAFFTEMAQTYGNKPNVIFEIFNEPDNESWGEVKSYAKTVIGAIRGTGANNIVVVGTPTWSQDVDKAADDPINEYSNVAYTLHFYAGSHKAWLRSKASYAMSKGLALFVTEWGTCDASGNGGTDLAESQAWMTFLDQNKISHANWSLFDKPESASALMPGASTSGGWPDSALTESGKFAKQKIQEGAALPPGGNDVSGTIALRAAVDNEFVCAENGGAAALISNRSQAQAWEQFDVIKNGDGTVSFRSHANSKYVTAEDAGKSALIANRTAIGKWEKFTVIKNGDGTVSFMAMANNRYVAAENAGKSALIANRTAIGQWEKFWVVPQ